MDTIVYGFAETRFGPIIVARTPQGICDLQFLGYDRMRVIHELGVRWGKYTPTTQDDEMAAKVAGIVFEGKKGDIPLYVKGTDFQLKVWNGLLKIPFGTTTTYQTVAESIEEPKAIRSVATAILENPVAVIIPCHRVIHKDGTLGEYHWGQDLKKQLINWEKTIVEKAEKGN